MNKSGIYPVEFKVLVKPRIVEEKSKGGIIFPDQVKEKEKFAQQEGVVIAISPDAFEFERNCEWKRKPDEGDTVLFDRYAGCTVKGKDGEEYRLINDKEIGAIVNGS